MRRLVAVLMLAACGEDARVPAPARQLRQADTIGLAVSVSGATGDLLGSRLATCADGEVVGTAPGRPGLWTRDAGVFAVPASAGGMSSGVACVSGAAGSWVAMSGTSGLVARPLPGASWVWLTTSPVRGLGNAQLVDFPLAAGKDDGDVALFDATTGGALGQGTWGDGPVDGFAWSPDGVWFLVGFSSLGGVNQHRWDAGPGPVLWNSLYGGSGFGRALVIGNVSPRPGDELIIGGHGYVSILDATGVTITVLQGSTTSFGAALALSPSEYAGLFALWVGEPDSNRVLRFIGDAGADSTPTTTGLTTGMGAALAYSRQTLYVGAPTSPPGGEILMADVTPTPVARFALRECAPGNCLDQGCVGACVGGVVCDYSFCATFDGGVRPDAGAGLDASIGFDGGTFVDAGAGLDASIAFDGGTLFDAGSVIDAGQPDAGEPGDAGAGEEDGGEADAGSGDGGGFVKVDSGVEDPGAGKELSFVATGCGCSTGGALPLGLGLALLLRARRRQTVFTRGPSSRPAVQNEDRHRSS